MLQEEDIRYRIERTLEHKSWIFDPANPNRNVYFESSLPEETKGRLGSSRPDYTLFLDNNPVGVIGAKRPGVDLNKALEQGLVYAEKLNAPLILCC